MSFSRVAKRRTKKHYRVASLQDAEKILEAGKIVDDHKLIEECKFNTCKDLSLRVKRRLLH